MPNIVVLLSKNDGKMEDINYTKPQNWTTVVHFFWILPRFTLNWPHKHPNPSYSSNSPPRQGNGRKGKGGHLSYPIAPPNFEFDANDDVSVMNAKWCRIGYKWLSSDRWVVSCDSIYFLVYQEFSRTQTVCFALKPTCIRLYPYKYCTNRTGQLSST